MTSVDIASGNGEGSVFDLVKEQYGVEVTVRHKRFVDSGWSLQGLTTVPCGECDPSGSLVAYRKPYSTAQGEFRYWALVCVECRTAIARSDLDEEGQRKLRVWEAKVLIGELEPNDDESAGATGEELTPNAAEVASTSATPDGDGASGFVSKLDTVRVAARLELDAIKGALRTVDAGVVEPDGNDPQVLRVDQPSLDLSEQSGAEMFVAEEPGSPTRFPVTKVLFADRTAVVFTTASGSQELAGMRLYVAVDPKVVAEAFVKHLDSIDSAGVATVMLGKTQLRGGQPIEIAELNDQQQAAVGAIVADGVGAIWGPPGTGKTRVIGQAVARLVEAGAKVALVSNTNIAVDQALIHIARALDSHDPGTVVRVGHPSTPEVADHPHLTIRNLVATKQPDKLTERDACRSEIATLTDQLEQQIAEETVTRSQLGGRTEAAIASLIHRRDARAKLPDAVDRAEWESATHKRLSQACTTAARKLREAERAWNELQEYHDLEATQADLTARAERRLALESSLHDLARRLDEINGQSRLRWRKRRVDRRSVEDEAARLRQELDAVIELQNGLQLIVSEAAVAGTTPHAVRTARLELSAARERHTTAEKAADTASKNLTQATSEVERLEQFQSLEQDEIAAIELVDRCGSFAATVDHLAAMAEAAKATRQALAQSEERAGELDQQLADLERALVEKAQVVGTTLAQLVLHRGLAPRMFDHVIIDEASAALPPYAFAALSKATRGGALVGDFEQNWPISNASTDDLPHSVRPWLAGHPFALVGIRNAADAEARPGCVVLTRQYRFGPTIMRLANDVAYSGLLQLGRDRLIDQGDVVFVDVSDLGEAGRTHRVQPGRWGPAGAAIVEKLAESLEPSSLGVVTPYRAQAALISARLRDLGFSGPQIGTAHRFQGREFPSVVLDMVQDASGDDWIARAHRAGNLWQQSGVRLFNVGTTRCTERLFIVAHLGVVQRSNAGPLRALRRLLDDQGVSVWSAAELLGREPADPTPFPVPLHGPVGGAKLLDDAAFYDCFRRDVEKASKRVAIFSPFVSANRLHQVLPYLRAAVLNGVRVTALTKAPDELHNPTLLHELTSAGVTVRPKKGRHEKVVIIDEDVSYVGSLNALSNTGTTGELMMRFVGAELTERIADWMRATV